MSFRRFSLRLELLASDPLIWRRLWVDEAVTLSQLHHMIQAAMGWASTHEYQFVIDGIRYRRPDEDDVLVNEEIEDDADCVLADVFKTGKPDVLYRYDMGDNWEHRIVVEQTMAVDEPSGYAVVAAGERACPPEDFGGIHTYNTFVKGFEAARQSPRVNMHLERLGDDFDPARFDRHAANAALMRLAWNGWDRLTR